MITDVARRHDFVLLFDVTDGNPNGDPDAGNMPRVDPETMQGLVTDGALKRKIRNWVDLARGTESRYKIYMQSNDSLNVMHQRAYDAIQVTSLGTKQPREDVDRARRWMCQQFWDIRMFGAVMSTSVNCGHVRGPMQLTFARSVDLVVHIDVAITRIAVTREEDAQIRVDPDSGVVTGKSSEMGRKSIVPYGLYRAYGFFSPHLAQQTGANAEDLEVFWQALQGMWDIDRSAARGMISNRGMYVFTHDTPLGHAPAHALFDLLHIARRPGVAAPRSISDYQIDLDSDHIPDGVTVTVL